MEEIKNLFIKGRMNQDVDDRIVPGGEYREARNVIITNSEGSDAGAVQRIKGFTEVADFGNDFRSIHMLADNSRNLLYIWLAPANLFGTNSKIIAFNAENQTTTTLVEGDFLKLTISSSVHANVLENYLFWTDGVNQPRVIDIEKAIESAQNNVPYYTEEHHISVAKYNPYKVARAVTINNVEHAEFVDDFTIDILPNHGSVNIGDFLVNITPQKNRIIGIITAILDDEITLDRDINSTFDDQDSVAIVSSTMTDQSGVQNWEGDPDLLEDKFVRFSYRYKYDDDTYSLIAPYTQVMYIPKQRGYFLEGDEERAYKSTVVKFMENAINNIDLFIPLPSNQPEADYHIKEIEIIYTESDAVRSQVVDSISVSDASGEILDTPGIDGVHFKYTYKSKLPYKTVTQQDYIRVSDQIPIKAEAQSISGNRVMYANYDTRLDAPETINFGLTSNEKLAQNILAAEYPTHTLKQNRQYQAGIVLKDKFGRSSGVITSGFFNDVNNSYPSSTFHAFKDASQSIAQWLGDSLRVVIYDAIESENLYANEVSTVTVSVPTDILVDGNNITVNSSNTWQTGKYLRGEYIDYVKITNVSGNTYTCDGAVSTEYYKYNPGLGVDQSFGSYEINPIGWYSFNFVVKQTEHDYYNAYLPGILNGKLKLNTSNTDFERIDQGSLGTIVLYSDNINKVPRDLNEVGPDQEQYRSSGVRLHGRVQNIGGLTKQIYPGRIDNEVTRIGTFRELFTNVETAVNVADFNTLENVDSNPLIGIIENTTNYGEDLDTFSTNLAIFEAEPVQSRLDIYWETSTSGLISDLNTLINNSSDGPVFTDAITTAYNENTDFSSGENVTNSSFKVYNGQGAELNGLAVVIDTVKDKNNTIINSHPFTVSIDDSDPVVDKIDLVCNENYEFVKTSPTLDSYVVTLKISKDDADLYKDIDVDAINSGVAGTLWQTFPDPTFITANGGNHEIEYSLNPATPGNLRIFELILDNGSVTTTKYAETALNISNVQYDESNIITFPTEANDGLFEMVPPGPLPFPSYTVVRSSSGDHLDPPANSGDYRWSAFLTTTGLNVNAHSSTLTLTVKNGSGTVIYTENRTISSGTELSNEEIRIWAYGSTGFFDNYYLEFSITCHANDIGNPYTLNIKNRAYEALDEGGEAWSWTEDVSESWESEGTLTTTDTPSLPLTSADGDLEVITEINGNDKHAYVRFSSSAQPKTRQNWYFDWTVIDCDGQPVGLSESGTFKATLLPE